MKNVFDKQDTSEIISRINQLSPDSERQWGKMTVAQMLAHCNVTYEMVYTDKHKKPNAIARFMLKLFVKSAVVSEKPYPQNSRTAPQFLVDDDKDFQAEKDRLIAYIEKTQKLGANHFNNKESHSFGPLSTQEWNNLFYKHLAHHLTQFGV